jgi:hypothetical protein
MLLVLLWVTLYFYYHYFLGTKWTVDCSVCDSSIHDCEYQIITDFRALLYRKSESCGCSGWESGFGVLYFAVVVLWSMRCLDVICCAR